MRALICLAAICAATASAVDIPANVMDKIKSDTL